MLLDGLGIVVSTGKSAAIGAQRRAARATRGKAARRQGSTSLILCTRSRELSVALQLQMSSLEEYTLSYTGLARIAFYSQRPFAPLYVLL